MIILLIASMAACFFSGQLVTSHVLAVALGALISLKITGGKKVKDIRVEDITL